MSFLAYAEQQDQSNGGLVTLLLAAFLVVIVWALAFLPVWITWVKRRGRADGIMAGAIVWGLLTAGSLINFTLAQLNWSKERMLRLETGYFDPHDTGDAPLMPWKLWVGLAIAYGVLLAWALLRKRLGPVRRLPKDLGVREG